MIFLTVGSQLPFDRLVKAVDRWVESTGRDDVFGQIGNSQYEPLHFGWTRELTPRRCAELSREAEVVVAHAGMGSIISALSARTPILVLPRSASAGEHRNDHQFHTVRALRDRPGLYVAEGEEQIHEKLEEVLKHASGGLAAIPEFASNELIRRIHSFISN